jgi:hypothetical protein
MESLAGKGIQYGNAFVNAAKSEVTFTNMSTDILSAEDAIKLNGQLIELFNKMVPIGTEFGFRTIYEISRFIFYHAMLTESGWNFNDALDAQIVQKLMPKLHGSDRKLRPVLDALKIFCADNRLPLSLEKTNRMLERLKDGFTSFAEA